MNKKTAVVCAIAVLVAIVILCWRQASTQNKVPLPTGEKPTLAVAPDPCQKLPSGMQYVLVSPMDFHPETDMGAGNLGNAYSPGGHTYRTNDDTARVVMGPNGISPAILYAPVHVPVGATIREVRATIIDNEPKMSGGFAMFKINMGSDWKKSDYSQITYFSSKGKAEGTHVFRKCDLSVKTSELEYYGIEFDSGEYYEAPAGASIQIMGAIRIGYTVP
jgi:hypothetical protein